MDVLVVGAGPAGSMAALVLARAGVRVGLVDRARFPRDKLCGDTINPGALAILDRMGPGATVRARALPVRGMVVSGAGARVTTAYPPRIAGAAIRRRDLDLLLVEAAIAAGASFEDGVRVDGPLMSDDGRRVEGIRASRCGTAAPRRARVVIAADGRASRLAGTLKLSRLAAGPRRWAFGAYFGGVAGLTDCGEMHVRSRGYLGIAPLPDGTANVCVVHSAEPGRAGPRVDQSKAIRQAVDEAPLLRARFANARQLSAVSVIGPLAVDAEAAGCPGMLLAGDAAGFVDPMTGDGLRFALRGGELAAVAALAELSSGTAAHETLWRARAREFSGKWRLNRVLRRVVASPRAVGAAAAVARLWPAPIGYLTCAAGDVHLALRSDAA